jgi:hypothetical protein
MTLDEFKAQLKDLKPGQAAYIPYELYEKLFPPGEPDQDARVRAYEFAKATGCVIDNRPAQREVLFVKARGRDAQGTRQELQRGPGDDSETSGG